MSMAAGERGSIPQVAVTPALCPGCWLSGRPPSGGASPALHPEHLELSSSGPQWRQQRGELTLNGSSYRDR